MKKNIWIVIILVLVVVLSGFWYATREKVEPVVVEETTKTYSNSNTGVSFTYPKILSANTAADAVTLHHEVTFTHHDYCDFKGDGETNIPTLTDFNVAFHIVDKDLVATMKSESPYIPAENFVNNQVVPSPGFIDSYSVGTLSGYKIFEGAEGCGVITYYFPISSQKTLVVKKDLITVFTGAIDAENQASAEAVPGVLNKEKETQTLTSILETVKVSN
jgi:hypothetical protein